MWRIHLDESEFNNMVDTITKLPEFSKYETTADHTLLYDHYLSIVGNNLDQKNQTQMDIIFMVNLILLVLYSNDAQFEICDSVISHLETAEQHSSREIQDGQDGGMKFKIIRDIVDKAKETAKIAMLKTQASGWKFPQVGSFIIKCVAGITPILLGDIAIDVASRSIAARRGQPEEETRMLDNIVSVVIINTIAFTVFNKFFRQTDPRRLLCISMAEGVILQLSQSHNTSPASAMRIYAESILAVAATRVGIPLIDSMRPRFASLQIPTFVQTQMARVSSSRRQPRTIAFRKPSHRPNTTPAKYMIMEVENIPLSNPDAIATDPRYSIDNLLKVDPQGELHLKDGAADLINKLTPPELERIKRVLSGANMQSANRQPHLKFAAWLNTLTSVAEEQYRQQTKMPQIVCEGCRELGCTFSYDPVLKCIHRNFPTRLELDHEIFYGKCVNYKNNLTRSIEAARTNAIMRGLSSKQAAAKFPDIPREDADLSEFDSDWFRAELQEQCELNIFPCPQMMDCVSVLMKKSRSEQQMRDIDMDYGFDDARIGGKLRCSRCCLNAFEMSLEACKNTSPASPNKWPVYLDSAAQEVVAAPAVAGGSVRISLTLTQLDELITKLTLHPSKMKIKTSGLLRQDETYTKELFEDYQNFEQECKIILSNRQEITQRVAKVAYREAEFHKSILRVTCPICPVFQPRRFNHCISAYDSSLLSLYCIGCKNTFNTCNQELAPVELTHESAKQLAICVVKNKLTIQEAYLAVVGKNTGVAKVSKETFIEYKIRERQQTRETDEDKKLNDFLTKNCPGCGTAYVIETGCRAMVCEKCNNGWCYTCGAHVDGHNAHDGKHMKGDFYGIECENVYFDNRQNIRDERYKFLAMVYERKNEFCKANNPGFADSNEKWVQMDRVVYNIKTGRCATVEADIAQNREQNRQDRELVMREVASVRGDAYYIPAKMCDPKDMLEWLHNNPNDPNIRPQQQPHQPQQDVGDGVRRLMGAQGGAARNVGGAIVAARNIEGNMRQNGAAAVVRPMPGLADNDNDDDWEPYEHLLIADPHHDQYQHGRNAAAVVDRRPAFGAAAAARPAFGAAAAVNRHRPAPAPVAMGYDDFYHNFDQEENDRLLARLLQEEVDAQDAAAAAAADAADFPRGFHGGNSNSKSNDGLCPARYFDVATFNPSTKRDCADGYMKTHPDKNSGCEDQQMVNQKFRIVRDRCDGMTTTTTTTATSNHSPGASTPLTDSDVSDRVFQNIDRILLRVVNSTPGCDDQMQIRLYAENYICAITNDALIGDITADVRDNKWNISFSNLILQLVNDRLLQEKYNTLITCITTMLNLVLKSDELRMQFIVIGTMKVRLDTFYEYCIKILNEWKLVGHELPGLSVFQLMTYDAAASPSPSPSSGGNKNTRRRRLRRQSHKKQARVSRKHRRQHSYIIKSKQTQNKKIRRFTRKHKVSKT